MTTFFAKMATELPDLEFHPLGTFHPYSDVDIAGKKYIVHKKHGIGIVQAVDVFCPAEPHERYLEEFDVAKLVEAVKREVESNANIPMTYSAPRFGTRNGVRGALITLFFFEPTGAPYAIVAQNSGVFCYHDINDLFPDGKWLRANADVSVKGVIRCDFIEDKPVVKELWSQETTVQIVEAIWEIGDDLADFRQRLNYLKADLNNAGIYDVDSLINSLYKVLKLYQKGFENFDFANIPQVKKD